MSVLRERRRELEASLAHLPPDAPERRAALAEFAAQTAAELPPSLDGGPAARQGAAPRADARRPWTALVLAVALIAPAILLYLRTGLPEAASPEFMVREPATLDELVADLRKRLQRASDDLEGWRLLGRAELARGRPAEARDALERALALAPADAQTKVDLADATAQAQGSVLEGRPITLIREALATDPRNAKGLALAGAYEVTQRNFPAAIGHWRNLLAVLPADSEQARQVSGFLADLEAGRLPQVADGSPPPTAEGAASDASPTALRGTVALERSIAPKLRPDDTLFVVVRTLDDAGQPAGPPVAVLRARGADLPLSFTLDDRHAMSPAARLSSVPAGTQVVIVARLSQRGEAAARSGDLQGASPPVRPGAAGLQVLINTVLE
jgi:cytochrome c-type biogenesis protein CcmH